MTALLAAGSFSPAIACLAGLALAIALYVSVFGRPTLESFRVSLSAALPIIALLAVALLFRFQPFNWIAGGQDQGVYVNMSSHFQQTGKIFGVDAAREALPDGLRAEYDRTNYKVRVLLESEKEGAYLPGVYLKDQQASEYVFQFYHLFPLWMATFAELIADSAKLYALTVFSLLSILAFYFLALEFTGSRGAAFLAGGLLALNPLHAFFSKFPVTEVMALTFSSLAFYYLLRYYRRAQSGSFEPGLLAISALAMACMFFTRVSGFMYIPFFYLILFVAQLWAPNRHVRRNVSVYVGAVFLFYGLSVIYGLEFSYPYVSDIYRLSFTRAFGEHWQRWLQLLGLLAALIYLFTVISGSYALATRLKSTVKALSYFLPHAIVAVIFLGGYRAFQLGFSAELLEHSWYGLRWKAAGTGAEAFLYWSPVVLAQYLSPFLVLAFVYTLFSNRRRHALELRLLLAFVLCFLGYISLLQWFIPYQYYYARYLLSEALPYTLLFTVVASWRLQKHRKLALAALGMAGVYMATYSATQLRGREMDGFESSLGKLDRYLAPGDTLLVGEIYVQSVYWAQLKTPLVFHYGYNVVSVDQDNSQLFLDRYCENQRAVYYLGGLEVSGLGPVYAEITVSLQRFEHVAYIPTQLVDESLTHGLYRVHCKGWKAYRAEERTGAR